MAVWQYLKGDLPTSDPLYDDGLLPLPGDAGFSASAATAALPADADGFNYVGPSAAAQA